MKPTEPLRLSLLAILLILVQLTLWLMLPGWRAGIDLYIVFLLLVTAAYGPLIGGAFALAGGLIFDAPSAYFIAFHLIYYLLPVLIGSHLRAYMLVEYRVLGTVVIGLLILGKALAQLSWGLLMGWLGSPWFLVRLNYWPLLILVVLIYLFWQPLIKLIHPAIEQRRSLV